MSILSCPDSKVSLPHSWTTTHAPSLQGSSSLQTRACTRQGGSTSPSYLPLLRAARNRSSWPSARGRWTQTSPFQTTQSAGLNSPARPRPCHCAQGGRHALAMNIWSDDWGRSVYKQRASSSCTSILSCSHGAQYIHVQLAPRSHVLDRLLSLHFLCGAATLCKLPSGLWSKMC